jgi:hypothetical protein
MSDPRYLENGIDDDLRKALEQLGREDGVDLVNNETSQSVARV